MEIVTRKDHDSKKDNEKGKKWIQLQNGIYGLHRITSFL